MIIAKSRRGISPVIATVLLIALVVAAGGVIWAISNDLIGGASRAELAIEDIRFSDSDENKMADVINFNLRNI